MTGTTDYADRLHSAAAAARERLECEVATVSDSLELLDRLADVPLPPAALYQGVLQPEKVAKVRAARLEADKQAFRMMMLRLKNEFASQEDDEAEAAPGESGEDLQRLPFELREVEAQETPDGFAYEIELDGRPLPPPENVRSTMASILQDLGEIPEDYLYAAGDGAYLAEDLGDRSSEDVWKGTYHEEGAFLYNEWDYERQNYRKNWAVLRELDVTPHDAVFVNEISGATSVNVTVSSSESSTRLPSSSAMRNS